MIVAMLHHFTNDTSITATPNEWKLIDVESPSHIPYSLLIRESFQRLASDYTQVRVHVGNHIIIYSYRIVIQEV
jgi:hypothetical protein